MSLRTRVWTLALFLSAFLAGVLLAAAGGGRETVIREGEWRPDEWVARAGVECAADEILLGGGGYCAWGRLTLSAPSGNGWEVACSASDLGRFVQARSFAACMKRQG